MNKVFGVLVLFMKDGLVLGVARRDNSNDWGLVGGKVADDETSEEAAIRECKEETGLAIFNLKKVFEHPASTGEGMTSVTYCADWTGEPSTRGVCLLLGYS